MELINSTLLCPVSSAYYYCTEIIIAFADITIVMRWSSSWLFFKDRQKWWPVSICVSFFILFRGIARSLLSLEMQYFIILDILDLDIRFTLFIQCIPIIGFTFNSYKMSSLCVKSFLAITLFVLPNFITFVCYSILFFIMNFIISHSLQTDLVQNPFFHTDVPFLLRSFTSLLYPFF